MSHFLKSVTDASIRIPRNAQCNGITYYDIEITIGTITWTVRRRYKEFSELNDKLITEQSIPRDLLPPKKVIGNRSPTFLGQRQHHLEKYLQQILIFLQMSMCREFVEFLHFNKYDIIFLLQDLAELFCTQGDQLLMANKCSYEFSALEVYAIGERLKLPCPLVAGNVNSKNYDFSHVLDFCSQIEHVIVVPIKNASKNMENVSQQMEQYQTIGSSNIVPKQLKFDFNAFRNIKRLTINGLSTENICDAQLLRENIICLSIQNSGVNSISSILQCDCIHRCIDDTKLDQTTSNWQKLEIISIVSNAVTTIDGSIQLAPKLIELDLSKNHIRSISNLNCLPYLNTLNLCANQIVNCCGDMHLEVGNVKTLDLSVNQIVSLHGFRKMYSLVTLNLSCNSIADINEVDHIAALPCLEELILTGNPIATGVDYRPRVLSRFGDRCEEIVLDNEKGDSMEIDMALVLAALRKSEMNPQFQAPQSSACKR